MALLAAGLIHAPGCTVSVFGSDEMTIIGAPAPGGEGGSACGEPDDARQAREDAERCVARCSIDAEGALSECPYIAASDAAGGRFTIDMSQSDGLIFQVEVCDPDGVVFQLADSPTADADGGDQGTSSHDASVLLDERTLILRPSENSDVDVSMARDFVAPSGCTTRTLVVADQIVYLVEPEHGLCGQAMLRIAPPDDLEGLPDSNFHLALGSALDGTSSGGSGFHGAELCFY